jgi:single-strand DNA-binding protein
MDFNQVIVCGRITRDPDCIQLPSGQLKCSFTVATNHKYTDSDGDLQERTEFNSVVAWRRDAEVMQRFGRKGTQVLVVGHLETRTWEDKVHPDMKHYRTEIVLERLRLGPKTHKPATDERQEHASHQNPHVGAAPSD